MNLWTRFSKNKPLQVYSLLIFGVCSVVLNLFVMCKSSAQSTQDCNAPLKEGIRGTVIFKTGNFMPSPDAPSGGMGAGVRREVHIYELTNMSQVRSDDSQFYTSISTRLVKKVQSDEQGCFRAELPAGRYSLFVKEGDKLYANLFDGENNIFPVTVEKGKVNEVRFDINYDATY
jgi:hypothetical protein